MIREEAINRADVQKHIYTRLYETALNNVGYKCEADKVFADIAENRLSTWISEIPSMQLKTKTGRWVLIPNYQFNGYPNLCCDQCRRSVQTRTNYCPHCGAKMEGWKK